MAFWRFIFVLAAVVALASCQSLTAPPGFASGGGGTAGRIEFPDGVSLEAQYALLTWYCEEHGAAAERQAAESYGVALNARNESAAVLRGNAVCSLASRYPGFAYVPPQGGIAFRCNILGTRTDFKEMDAMLAACQEALCAPCSIEVPVEECVRFLTSYMDVQETSLFQKWSARNGRLVLAIQEEGAPRDLRLCREALQLKSEILEGRSSAQALLQTGNDDIAGLEVLEAISRHVGATKDLRVIDDYTTISDFERYRIAAPGKCVKEFLSRWPGESGHIEDFEARLSASLSIWESDSRLREALRREEKLLHNVVESMLNERLLTIEQQSASAVVCGDFWRWISWANDRVTLLQSEEPSIWGCYVRQGLSEKLISALTNSVAKVLPAAVTFYRQAQFEAATITDRQAVVIALDEMLAALEHREAVSAPSESCIVAQRRLAQRSALCSLKIEDFSSEIVDVSGKVFTKDLEQVLERILTTSHGGMFLGLTSDLASADYTLSAGRILEFTGDELETRMQTEKYRWYDEARLEENGGDVMFAQELKEEEISIQTWKRTGCVRIRGELRGDGDAVHLSFEDACPMDFVQENVVSTKTIQIVRSKDERELRMAGAPRELRHERVWSAAEMIDFCRQRTLEFLPEQLLCQILDAEYASAVSESNILERAEKLGELFYALQKCAFPEESAIENKCRGYLAVLPSEIRQAVVVGLVKTESAL